MNSIFLESIALSFFYNIKLLTPAGQAKASGEAPGLAHTQQIQVFRREVSDFLQHSGCGSEWAIEKSESWVPGVSRESAKWLAMQPQVRRQVRSWEFPGPTSTISMGI